MPTKYNDRFSYELEVEPDIYCLVDKDTDAQIHILCKDNPEEHVAFIVEALNFYINHKTIKEHCVYDR